MEITDSLKLAFDGNNNNNLPQLLKVRANGETQSLKSQDENTPSEGQWYVPCPSQ